MTTRHRYRLRLFLFVNAIGPLYAFQATLSVPRIARSVSPSVVLITTCDQRGNPLTYGSGFVVAPDGLIATSLHVVEGAHAASVTIADGGTYEALGVAEFDRRSDLILLKIKALRLRAVSLGDSDKVQIGQHVVTVGNPKGLAGSVSDGIVSGLRHLNGLRIQITAPISPGSSGGPLLNDAGEVIGINQATIEDGQNLNLAIPVNDLKLMIMLHNGDVALLKNPVLTTLAAVNALLNAESRPDDVRSKAKKIEDWEMWVAENWDSEHDMTKAEYVLQQRNAELRYLLQEVTSELQRRLNEWNKWNAENWDSEHGMTRAEYTLQQRNAELQGRLNEWNKWNAENWDFEHGMTRAEYTLQQRNAELSRRITELERRK
jgi:hypothetical protein